VGEESRDLLAGEERGEGLDFGGTQFGGVTLMVEEDEAAHPVHLGLLGAMGVMLDAQGITDLVQQFFSP